MFIAALFTIAKIWKNLFPTKNEWIKNMVHIYNFKISGHLKEGNSVIHDDMDEPGGQYGLEPGTKEQTPHNLTHVESKGVELEETA
jgi:hypothetical protein